VGAVAHANDRHSCESRSVAGRCIGDLPARAKARATARGVVAKSTSRCGLDAVSTHVDEFGRERLSCANHGANLCGVDETACSRSTATAAANRIAMQVVSEDLELTRMNCMPLTLSAHGRCPTTRCSAVGARVAFTAE
jgi:hypothetical protein